MATPSGKGLQINVAANMGAGIVGGGAHYGIGIAYGLYILNLGIERVNVLIIDNL